MASGISVSDDVKLVFNQMRLHKSDEDSSQRLRIVTFTIDKDTIVVDKKICECDLCETDAYDVFKDLLKDDECFYILYDCHYESKEGIKKKEMIFGSWIPDSSNIKCRMKYASSKNAIKNAFKGLKHDLQMNDGGDFKSREAFSAHLDDVISVEGKPVHQCQQRR